jgi:hypothetical protein
MSEFGFALQEVTMSDARQVKKTKKTTPRKKGTQQEEPENVTLSKEKQTRLKELDDFIEGVLEDAGEDFLDQFKQIEGE